MKILVNILPQNLQLRHKFHHKLGPQQTFTLLEFQLELLVQDQIHMIHNHTQISSPRRNITFNFPSNTDDEIQDETQNITSFRNTSVDVSSPTRTILDNTLKIKTTQNTIRSMYDPPSFSSIFKYPNKTIRSENSNNQQTSSRYYDPFNYSFYSQSNTNIQTNNIQNPFQSNKNPNLLTQHSFPQPITNKFHTNKFFLTEPKNTIF